MLRLKAEYEEKQIRMLACVIQSKYLEHEQSQMELNQNPQNSTAQRELVEFRRQLTKGKKSETRARYKAKK